MHDCSLVGFEGDFVVGGPFVETSKEELEVAVVRVDVVNGGGKGGVVYVFLPSAIDYHSIVNEDQEAYQSHSGFLRYSTGEILKDRGITLMPNDLTPMSESQDTKLR